MGRVPKLRFRCESMEMVCAWVARQTVRDLVDSTTSWINHRSDSKTPRGTLNEDAMSTQPWPFTPALSAHLESYVDCERAAELEPIEVERWLKALRKKHGLENSTLVEIRKVMNLVYKHGQ